MALQPFDNEVRDRLIDELGEHGGRAVEFLDTANALLNQRPPSADRHGQAVAFCLRQAMRGISEAAGAGDPGAWKRLSRDVVDACEQYRRVRGLPSEDEQALDALFAQVDALKQYHDQERGHHERGLSRVMADVTGVDPVAVTAGPMEAFQRLLGHLNDAVYSRTANVDAVRLWNDCVEALRKLFLPPELRLPELERLAGLDHPTEQDRDAVVELVVSSEHLRRFLNAVESPRWLGLLTESGHLVPPNNGGSWPVLSAVRRLAESHPQQVTNWLEDLAREHRSDTVPARGTAAGDALQGFGWFSEVEPIGNEVWSQMTLKTLRATGGRIEWASSVAQRVAATPPSATGLAILDQLVRGSPSDWERRQVAEHARPMVASAQHLEDTVEYRRLRAALMERGLLE